METDVLRSKMLHIKNWKSNQLFFESFYKLYPDFFNELSNKVLSKEDRVFFDFMVKRKDNLTVEEWNALISNYGRDFIFNIQSSYFNFTTLNYNTISDLRFQVDFKYKDVPMHLVLNPTDIKNILNDFTLDEKIKLLEINKNNKMVYCHLIMILFEDLKDYYLDEISFSDFVFYLESTINSKVLFNERCESFIKSKINSFDDDDLLSILKSDNAIVNKHFILKLFFKYGSSYLKSVAFNSYVEDFNHSIVNLDESLKIHRDEEPSIFFSDGLHDYVETIYNVFEYVELNEFELIKEKSSKNITKTKDLINNVICPKEIFLTEYSMLSIETKIHDNYLIYLYDCGVLLFFKDFFGYMLATEEGQKILVNEVNLNERVVGSMLESSIINQKSIPIDFNLKLINEFSSLLNSHNDENRRKMISGIWGSKGIEMLTKAIVLSNGFNLTEDALNQLILEFKI